MDSYVYILKCRDGSYYTGHTDDLERRIAAHQCGGLPGHTQIYSDTFQTREEALAAEFQIKRWSRKKKEALIGGDWDALKVAAKKEFSKR